MGIITVRPGETVTVVGVSSAAPIQPPGPVDPGFSPPWAQVGGPRPSHPIALPGDPWWGGGGPVDPGWSGGVAPPPRPTHPIALPGDPWWGGGGQVDPGYGVDIGHRPSHPISLPGDPWWGTKPPTEPPPQPVEPGGGNGNTWAWSPQLQRWVWVYVPPAGEATPKA
jgi:hypothetical protein